MTNQQAELEEVYRRIVDEDDLPPPIQNQPWDQRRFEPDDKYLAFQVYLDLGSKRSYTKAAKSLGKTKNTIYNWSNTYDWLERADAYDRAKYLELKQKMMERFGAEIEKNYETNLRLSKLSAEILQELVYSLAE